SPAEAGRFGWRSGGRVTYVCFIETRTSAVPHMERMVSLTLSEAVQEARDLMRLHASARAGHIFKGDHRLETVIAEDPEAV
ncbi:MAG: hypothetical protein EBR82_30730, partial [Caulobacteraceae bacterium]|nr:hypothetical protein [Caulobacteraceae bacterium]